MYSRMRNAFYLQTEVAAKSYVTRPKKDQSARWDGGEAAGLHSTFTPANQN